MALTYIHISLSQRGKAIGNCRFLKIHSLDDSEFLELSNLKLNDKIDSNFKLTISIFLKNVYLVKFSSQILESKHNDSSFYKIKNLSKKLNKTNQICLKIFNDWQNRIENNWKEFKTVKEKYAWIKCCNILNGVSTSIKLRKHYIIDGNIINHPVDLYCLIGELFMGERGYMGSEYNSFIDCLTQAGIDSNSKNTNNSEITILNYKKLNKTISKIKYHETLLEDIINELKISQFKPDEAAIDKSRIYIKYAVGAGKTRLDQKYIEKKLNVVATIRNWNTVTTLLEMFE